MRDKKRSHVFLPRGTQYRTNTLEPKIERLENSSENNYDDDQVTDD